MMQHDAKPVLPPVMPDEVIEFGKPENLAETEEIIDGSVDRIDNVLAAKIEAETAARGYFSDDEQSKQPPLPKLNFIDWEKLEGKTPPPRVWIVRDWMPATVCIGLYGDGGTGKSTLAQQLQSSAALKLRWAGLDIAEAFRSDGYYCEDEGDELWRRQVAINALLGRTMTEIKKAGVNVISRVGEENHLMVYTSRGKAEFTPFYSQVIESALDNRSNFVIFDNASNVFAGDENDRSQVVHFVTRGIGSVARSINGSVIMLAHPSRAGINSGTGDSGSTQWSNAFRSRLYLSRPEIPADKPQDGNARLLTRKKANYATINDEIKMRWCNGVIIPDSAAAAASMNRRPIVDIFFQMLDRLTRQGQPVSNKLSATSNGPRFLAKQPENEGYTPAEFERVIINLLAEERIGLEDYGPPSAKTQKVIRK
jgi:RecA-family ATPase